MHQALRLVRPETLLLLAGLSVVPAVVAMAEACLALLDRDADAPSSGIDALHQYSEAYGWEPRPGSYVDEGRLITINAAGYRGPLLAAPAAPERIRVIVLGDSVAFGLYLGDEETYAARLAARRPALDVANLAVQGYGPGQSLLRLERLGLSLAPDIVVLGLCLGNDFADAMLPTFLYDESHPKPYFRDQHGRLVLYDEHLKLDARSRLSLWLQDNSRLFRAMHPGRGKDAGDEPSWTKRRGSAMSDRQGALGLVARLVGESRDRAEARGARFLVLLHPDRVAGARAAATWERALLERLEGAGVETLSLAQAYAERGLAYERLTIDSIGHLNALGHEVTAAVLAERLDALVPGPRRASLTDTSSRPLR